MNFFVNGNSTAITGESSSGSNMGVGMNRNWDLPVQAIESDRLTSIYSLMRNDFSNGAAYSSSAQTLQVEPFKFISRNCEHITVLGNYTVVEAIKPTAKFTYMGRQLTPGKLFCLSVNKLLNEKCSDYSFVVGFTTCSPASTLNDLRHLTTPCTPNGCGGHSQQVKIFRANKIASKVTFDRQDNGDIYFSIDDAKLSRIIFDTKSCDVNFAAHNQLTPYIQLSGNVLSLTIETNHEHKLYVHNVINEGQALESVTAFVPPVTKRHLTSQPLGAILPEQAHRAFVASSHVDTKFMNLKYPENYVKLFVNQTAILRKTKRGERFVFYLDKDLTLNSEVTIQVTKTCIAVDYAQGFEFGVTTLGRNLIIKKRKFLDSASVQKMSHLTKTNPDITVNDMFTLTRTACGAIQVKKNGVVQSVKNMKGKLLTQENLSPFVILNGKASGVIVNNGTSDTEMEFDQNYGWPPVEFRMSANVELTNVTLITWTQNGESGVIINSKPFDSVLKFAVRKIQTSDNAHSMTFGIIRSDNIGFKTPREISNCLDVRHENLIPLPALGLRFSVYKTPYGKVTLKCDNSDAITLFKVDPSKCYYPVIIFNGSVVAIELLPNPRNTTINFVSNSTPPQIAPPTNDCHICMESAINSVFIPCGHRFACIKCANKLRQQLGVHVQCPVCRQSIENVIQTFDCKCE